MVASRILHRSATVPHAFFFLRSIYIFYLFIFFFPRPLISHFSHLLFPIFLFFFLFAPIRTY